MTQEEKAKAYDEALDKIKMLLGTGSSCSREELEYVFPELAESDDEKIMEKVIATIHLYYGEPLEDEAKEMIAWLEKQGEHANFINKIQIGDKVTRNEDGVLVNLSQLNRVAKKDEKQGELKPANKTEPKFKVGDWIITDKKHIWLVDEDCSTTGYLYRLVAINGKVEVAEFEVVDKKARLWTIQDAKDGDVLHCWIDGYEFVLIYKGIKDGYITTYGHLYQNLKSFSEEPTTMFCRTIQGHFTPATKEQHDLLFQKMKEAGYEWDAEKKELKKIEQKPAEWSEEDDQYLLVCKNALTKYQVSDKWDAHIISHWLENKLKSLKERVQPQSHWKPNEEQMEMLNEVLNFAANHESPHWNDYIFGTLNNLIRQLKKLIEE